MPEVDPIISLAKHKILSTHGYNAATKTAARTRLQRTKIAAQAPWSATTGVIYAWEIADWSKPSAPKVVGSGAFLF